MAGCMLEDIRSKPLHQLRLMERQTHDVAWDALDLLCGNPIGEGEFRAVYECNIDENLVVKVEEKRPRRYSASNIMEYYAWHDTRDNEWLRKWLAPCEILSPSGRILLQRKVKPLPKDFAEWPDIPMALKHDLKPSNWGILDDRLVSIDYAMMESGSPNRLVKPKKWIVTNPD